MVWQTHEVIGEQQLRHMSSAGRVTHQEGFLEQVRLQLKPGWRGLGREIGGGSGMYQKPGRILNWGQRLIVLS